MRNLISLPLFGLLFALGCYPDGSNDISAAAGDAASGETLYAANCASCHGADATGGSGPNIAGIGDSNGVIDTILYGEGSMPGFGDSLSDAEISDILAWLGSL